MDHEQIIQIFGNTGQSFGEQRNLSKYQAKQLRLVQYIMGTKYQIRKNGEDQIHGMNKAERSKLFTALGRAGNDRI
ncbi:hypothetical protein EYC80_006261 [Monilinia laxa]|uniref:Uncharacterized protein n=1 Tax=Monilinia laxa TaxID=61186 RepID=A0A5N6KGZ1_MONLA|nr:hypothetical protein EYC80_006261 [Monilinia laxa]